MSEEAILKELRSIKAALITLIAISGKTNAETITGDFGTCREEAIELVRETSGFLEKIANV